MSIIRVVGGLVGCVAHGGAAALFARTSAALALGRLLSRRLGLFEHRRRRHNLALVAARNCLFEHILCREHARVIDTARSTCKKWGGVGVWGGWGG